MATVGYATLQIIPSARGFQGALDKGIQPAVGASGKKAGVAMGGSMKTGILGSLKSIAAPLAAIFGARAIYGQLKSAVNEASNLGESVNAVNVVFGKAAGGILDLGNNAAKAVGLSKTEFNGLAVQFSNFAETVAGPGGNVVNTMKELTGRASDFASVMNLDVNEAATLFQSGLAGQTEPLRRYGIDMSAAAVEAHALATGIVSSKSELTESAKVQARYSLLMAATAKTQGDFANTSDSLANRQRILSASWKNAKASLGGALVPVMEKALGVVMQLFDGTSTLRTGVSSLIDAIRPVGAAISSAFADLKETAAFQTFLGIVGQITDFVRANLQPILIGFGTALAAVGLPVLFGLIGSAVGGVTAAFALLFSPIILTTVAITAVVAGVIIAYKRFETFRNIVDTVVRFVTGTVLPGLKTFTSWLITTVPPIVQRVAEGFLKAFTSIREAVKSAIDFVRDKLTKFMGWAAPTWQMFTVLLSRVVDVAWGLIKGAFQIGFALIKATVETGWAVISGVFKVASTLIGTVVSAAWTLIKGVISGGMQIIGGIIRTALALITGNWGQAWEGVKQVLRGAWTMIKAAVEAGITLVVGLFAKLPGSIIGALGNIAGTLFNAGKDVIGGFIRGIKSMAGGVISAVKSTITDALPGFVKKALGISSPSKVFAELGAFSGLGFAKGIESMTDRSQDAMKAMVSPPSVAAINAASGGIGRQDGGLSGIAARLDRLDDVVSAVEHLDAQIKRQTDRGVLLTRTGVKR